MPAKQSEPAVLGLADGSVFRGRHFGHPSPAVGEVVFNTSYTGYQEVITDASYCDQIVTFTFPHIGNVGANPLDVESQTSHASAVVIRDQSIIPSSWRSAGTLDGFLKEIGIPGISGIDTRKLTRLLRDRGAANGCVLPGEDAAAAVERAREFSGLEGSKLAPKVSAASRSECAEGTWDPESNRNPPVAPAADAPAVAVLDCGVKANILRMLAQRGLRPILMPYSSAIEDLLGAGVQGVLVSNGPGDPGPCEEAIRTMKGLLERQVPVFGICLGAQILALAAGCSTEKMKFGHHGCNHPVLDENTRQVAITSQNHGFAISREGMPDNVAVTHVSLFDGSIQGIRMTDAPAFAFQGHPEASPGPHDVAGLFDRFAELVRARA